MSTDLTSYATVLTNATTVVTALIVAIAGLLTAVRIRRRAQVRLAPVLIYVASGSGGASTGDLDLPRPINGTLKGTLTSVPQWVSSTRTPLVIIFMLLLALDVTLLQRTSDVEPVSKRVAPVITDARAFTYEYDRDGNIGADNVGYIVFNVAGTWDGLDRMTRSSIPTTTERSDFSWKADLEKVSGVGWGLTMFDPEPPASLIAARLTLRTGDLYTYSIARVGGEVTPVIHRTVYVYARGLGDDVRNTDTWIKIGDSTLTPSGAWSVVGTVSSDRSPTVTTPVAAANISLTAIVVSSEDAAAVTTTLTLADLDAMGRSEIVTVVPHRGLQRGQVTVGVAGDPSRTTPATGVPRQR